MDELREGVYLRSQGQKDPLVEYKIEGYELFVNLMEEISQDSLHNLFRSAASMEAFLAHLHAQPSAASTLKLNLPEKQPARSAAAPGRNDVCPCGSGKKYKHCCGRIV